MPTTLLPVRCPESFFFSSQLKSWTPWSSASLINALVTARRRIRQNRDRAPAHRQWLVEKRQCVAGRAEIAAANMRPVFVHDIEVGCGHASVFAEPELRVALEG